MKLIFLASILGLAAAGFHSGNHLIANSNYGGLNFGHGLSSGSNANSFLGGQSYGVQQAGIGLAAHQPSLSNSNFGAVFFDEQIGSAGITTQAVQQDAWAGVSGRYGASSGSIGYAGLGQGLARPSVVNIHGGSSAYAGYAAPTYAQNHVQYAPPVYAQRQGQYAPPAYSQHQVQYAPPAYAQQQVQYAPPAYAQKQVQYAPPAYAQQQAQYAPPAYAQQQVQYAPPAYAQQQVQYAPPAYAQKQVAYGTPVYAEKHARYSLAGAGVSDQYFRRLSQTSYRYRDSNYQQSSYDQAPLYGGHIAVGRQYGTPAVSYPVQQVALAGPGTAEQSSINIPSHGPIRPFTLSVAQVNSHSAATPSVFSGPSYLPPVNNYAPPAHSYLPPVNHQAPPAHSYLPPVNNESPAVPQPVLQVTGPGTAEQSNINIPASGPIRPLTVSSPVNSYSAATPSVFSGPSYLPPVNNESPPFGNDIPPSVNIIPSIELNAPATETSIVNINSSGATGYPVGVQQPGGYSSNVPSGWTPANFN